MQCGTVVAHSEYTVADLGACLERASQDLEALKFGIDRYAGGVILVTNNVPWSTSERASMPSM